MNNSSIYPPIYPTKTTGTITSGNVFTAGSSGGAGIYYTTAPANPYADVIIGSNGTSTLRVKGNAEFEGDIKLNGKSLDETLTKIEERLAILHANPKLEEKWEKLKELGKQYRELETDIIEKEKIWSILKK
jgi:hypothetical protein